MITVLEHAFFLISISWVSWSAEISHRKRLLALLSFIVLFTVLAVYLDSFFISVMNPLHPVYFAAGILGSLLEAALFLGATWLINRFLTSGQRSQPRD